MTELTLTIVLLLCALLIGELILWRMFRRRVDSVMPSVGRMRVFAVAHTLALAAWIVCSVLWLW